MNVALRSLDYISLCAGGGGLDLGFELAVGSARPVLLVEREAFAVAHLVAAMEQGLMAAAPVWSDVRTLNARRWRGAVDFVIGGIPCQPHSLAGKRRGAGDERDLWSDARRIIVASGAWGVLIENVEGMLTAADGQVPGAHRVVNDLERLGFIVEGGLFSAAETGATHQRNRVFIIALHAGRMADADKPVGGGEPSAGQFAIDEPDAGTGGEPVGDASGDESERRRSAGNMERPGGVFQSQARQLQRQRRRETAGDSGAGTLADASGGGCDGRANGAGRGPEGRGFPEWSGVGPFPPGPADIDGWRAVIAAAPELEPAFCRMADGVAAGVDDARLLGRVDRLRMLGNGVHPLAAAYAVRTLLARLADRGAAGAAELVMREAA